MPTVAQKETVLRYELEYRQSFSRGYTHRLKSTKKHNFFLKINCSEKFQDHREIESKVQKFPIYPLLPHMCSLLVISSPHQRCTFITPDEPTLTHHNHAKPIIYIVSHFWCTLCTFGQVYNHKYQSLRYHTSSVLCLFIPPHPCPQSCDFILHFVDVVYHID